MKRCVRCGDEKPLDEFWNNKRKPDGKQPRCKTCYRPDARTCERGHITVSEKQCMACFNEDKEALAAQGLKRCTRCSEVKPYADYHKGRARGDGFASSCRRCALDMHLIKTFGITLAQYEMLLEAQGGCCAICGFEPKEGGKRLAVDHNHKHCGKRKACVDCVRGLICYQCNLNLLPGARDVSRTAYRAGAYLASPPAQRVLNPYTGSRHNLSDLTLTSFIKLIEGEPHD